MTRLDSPRRHLLLPWTAQEREDPVLEFDHGDGVFFYDRQGRRYLDFLSQLFQGNLGHGNRRVIEAVRRQAGRACCVSPQLLTAERSALAAELARRSPGDLTKCFFVNSGSEADDQAFILARMVTGRPKIFAKYRSYHGNLEVTSELKARGRGAARQLGEERRSRPPYRDRRVHVTARETYDEAQYVIRDEGPGFDPFQLPDHSDPANMEKAAGRGLVLIRTFMDLVYHNKAGNEITLIKRRPHAEPGA